ncbi:MAG: hypothetical protein ACE5I8_00325 [Thermodesulfobacteriota bacterium]
METDKEPINAEILAVLEKHPEGMKLRDLGNVLGVNWRSLVGSLSSLLHAGKVEKLNGLYFFVRRKGGKQMI